MKILTSLLLLPSFIFCQINPAFVFKTDLAFNRVEYKNEGMFGFESNGKFGYMDKTGKVIIPADYSYSMNKSIIPNFLNGFTPLLKDSKAGVIDKTGKVIIPFEYESTEVKPDSKNYFVVSKKEGTKTLYGMVNAQNKIIIPLEYYSIRIDSNLVVVSKNENTGLKYKLFDLSGKELLPPEYSSLFSYAKEKLLLAEKGTQYGFIDITGKWLFEKTKSVYSLLGCKEGMIRCQVSLKYGYLNLKGEEVIVTKYDYATDFQSYGLAYVGKKDPAYPYTQRYGYIDKKGTEIVPLKFEYIGFFQSNGLAYAKDPETNRYGYLDKTGKWAIKPVYLEGKDFDDAGGAWVKMTDDKYHYINSTGKDIGMLTDKGTEYKSFGKDGFATYENTDQPYILLDKTGKTIKKIDDCDGIYSFSDGIAGFKSKSTGKYGFLDLNGNKIIPAEYDGFTGFVEGVSKVNKTIDGKTKYGYIDTKGNLLTPIVYENAQNFRDGWGLIKKDGNYFFVDRNGNLKDPPAKYDELSEFRSGYALGKLKGSDLTPPTFHYINTKLEIAFSISAWQAYLFWENVAVVSRDNKTYELMNKKGEVFKTLTGIETLNFCSEGMLVIRENGKWGYINDKGDVIVTPKYDTCTSFKYGFAKVRTGTKYGIIDKSGTMIIEPKYENILPGENSIFTYFDAGWGAMDKTGKIIIQPTLYTVTTFEKDRALAKMGKTFTILKSPLSKN